MPRPQPERPKPKPNYIMLSLADAHELSAVLYSAAKAHDAIRDLLHKSDVPYAGRKARAASNEVRRTRKLRDKVEKLLDHASFREEQE